MKGLSADLVLRNGDVITVDSKNRSAEAVAVLNGLIVRVGTDEEMEPLIGRETKVIDLAGKTLIPGFIDSHTHNAIIGEFRFSYKLIDMAAELNPSVIDLQRKIKERVKETPRGDWIGGKNLDPNGLKERRWPAKEELDVSAPGNPVLLMIRGGHACMLNSKALQLAGITKDTPSPEGGVIEKDPRTGEPTGVLRDVLFNKDSSLMAVLPQSTLKDLKDGLALISQEYAKIGVTSTGDAGAADRPESYRAYQEAITEGCFKTRTYLMIHDEFYRKNDLGLRTGFGNDRLRLGAVKLLLDGSIQCHTCAFYEPYATKETRGLEGMRYTQEQLNEVVLEAHRLGYQVAIHAQGDYGITVAVNAIEHAMTKYPRPDPRHRIEHTLCPTLEDLRRMKKLGMIGNFFVFHPWFWGDQHINNFLGKERASRMVPIKTAMELGIVACAHSDCPVCTPGNLVWPSDPLWGMWCAVNRKTRSGVDIGPQEKLTSLEALRAYTINGAYASFEEKIKGSIEPGKLADMVVLSANPLDVDPWEIRNIAVEKTIIGGEIVYENTDK